jgi:hypothetical protein
MNIFKAILLTNSVIGTTSKFCDMDLVNHGHHVELFYLLCLSILSWSCLVVSKPVMHHACVSLRFRRTIPNQTLNCASQLDYQDASAYKKQLLEICFSQNLAKDSSSNYISCWGFCIDMVTSRNVIIEYYSWMLCYTTIISKCSSSPTTEPETLLSSSSAIVERADL